MGVVLSMENHHNKLRAIKARSASTLLLNKRGLSSKILELLLKVNGKPIPLQSLESSFNCSSQYVHTALRDLRRQGYIINLTPSGYVIDEMEAQRIFRDMEVSLEEDTMNDIIENK